MSDTWYRYEDVAYSIANEFGEHGYSRIEVHLRKFKLVKRTPKGVWLIPWYEFVDETAGWSYLKSVARFVLLGAQRRFACPTQEEAETSFRARKKKQISIYQARIQRAEEALDTLERTIRHGA
jgi:hypothetical protein